MLRIGITGGIGSGKTTVAKIFETIGIPVYYADDAAKRLMNNDPALRKKITDTFGDVYNKEGLDRKKLAALLFNHPENVTAINAIVHPATIKDAKEWMERQTSPYALKEAALIFESGSEKDLDYVIGVAAPEDIRIQRVTQRDGIDEVEVRKRMNNQLSEEEKIKRCDFVIYNDDKQFLITQVMDLHQKLLKLAGN